MDPLWILVAFILGFVVNRVGLPPLVGYLIAGFVLKAFGVEGGETLEKIADLGVTLLLFSIGLKLRLRTLVKPEIWAGASIHMMVTVIFFGGGIYTLSLLRLPVFDTLDFRLSLLMAFALSFCSTVFAVKVLEERGDMSSLHGRVSIGILIMQDIFAVLFLTFSTGQIPSPWAIALVCGLLIARPGLFAILNRVGHRELLLLFSIFLALGLGTGGFGYVGLKPDLGALFIGILVADHPKAKEMAKELLNFKDLFLVGFFLSIGLAGVPSLQAVGLGGLLAVGVIFKVVFFFFLLTRFKLRVRTSLLTSFCLANYSEFGLLVATTSFKNGWIVSEWLTIIAISLSITLVLASPMNTYAHSIYSRLSRRLKSFETKMRLAEDQPIDSGDAEIAIFGMGRVGIGVYDDMHRRYGEVVIGIDFDEEIVQKQIAAGRNVICGDPTDYDFWVKSSQDKGKIQTVLLTLPEHAANMTAVSLLTELKYTGSIAATVKFDDEVEALKDAGAHTVFNLYTEAGYGFAKHVYEIVDSVGGKTQH
ncbi:MAG: cation:proton antiporter [Desulfobacteraceae bacterium]|nr:cation:proton antiporter [Desulfobacteraceae bacterium]